MLRFLGMALAVMAGVVVAVAAGPAASGPATQGATTKADAAYSAWAFDELDAAMKQREAAKALHVAKDVKVDLGGGVAMEFVLIPAGKYMMGDPPGRETTIEKAFYMGKFLVTQAQYTKVMGKNPSQHKEGTNPADSIDWPSATDFCRKASGMTTKTFACPARRSGNGRAGPGRRRGATGATRWQVRRLLLVPGKLRGQPHPVGQKKPNAFGLYDMMGNTWEWCSDGGGPEAADHPYRGATFGSREFMFKSTVRMTGGGPTANDRYGFRVAMDVD